MQLMRKNVFREQSQEESSDAAVRIMSLNVEFRTKVELGVTCIGANSATH